MKLFRWLLVGIVLCCAGALSAQDTLVPAEIPGEVIYIPFPVAITLDGDLSDWAGVPVVTVNRGIMTSLNPAENGSFTFAVAADTENFYIYMTMPDQTIITGQHGTNFWNEDSLEFFLNLSGERYRTGYTDGIFQININASDIGNTVPSAITITGTRSGAVPVQALVFKTDDGWGFEGMVPLSAYSIVPEHGLEIGFQAQANGASSMDRDVKLIWSLADTTDNSYDDPSLFGSGLFYEIGREDVPVASEPPEVVPEVELPPVASVNQTGYFVDGAKYGMLAADNEQRTVWSLIDTETSEIVDGGITSKGTFDPASGDVVQIADFSDFTTPGAYLLRINNILSNPFEISDSIYSQLKYDALAYFYLNRSGIAIEAEYAGEEWARPAGHLSDDNVTCYKGDDPEGNVWEGCDYTLDASKGWYDAGDYGKYVVNGGISVWTLLDLYEHSPSVFGDGSLSIPENTNDIPDILDEARWELEFMLGMQIPEGKPLAGMVYHKLHDLTWPPIPSLPPETQDNDNEYQNPGQGRYVYEPSTAATLNLAAVAAQCARIWADIDPDFADRCLTAAERAWQAADENPFMLAGNTPGDGGGNYSDDNVTDELFWAAAELYITTGSETYRDYLTSSPYFTEFVGLDPGNIGSMYWGDTAALGAISLAVVPNGLPDDDVATLQGQIVETADRYLETIAGEGYRVPLPPNGYAWGSSSSVLNNAIIMALAYDFTGEPVYLDGVTDSMDYIMGRNALNKSLVSGYGENPMQHPHHRFWANEPDDGYPPPPPGVVSGGPNGNPTDTAALRDAELDSGPAKRYLDDIDSFSTNEIAINWNAPLAWVVTYLDSQFNNTTDCQ